MKAPEVLTLASSDPDWPQQINDRLTISAPVRLWIIGNPEILSGHKIGLFCSARYPEDAIVHAHIAARKLCEEEATVVSGFHSPVELLRLAGREQRSGTDFDDAGTERVEFSLSRQTAHRDVAVPGGRDVDCRERSPA